VLAEEIMVYTSPVNIDVLPRVVDGEVKALCVRLRPYGKDWPKNIMVLGVGDTYEEALLDAFTTAQENRWEELNWSARPWEQYQQGAGWGYKPSLTAAPATPKPPTARKATHP